LSYSWTAGSAECCGAAVPLQATSSATALVEPGCATHDPLVGGKPLGGYGFAGCLDRDALYGEFQPLVRRLIRQYGGDDFELRQDLSGEVYFRFCSLLDAYDPTRGVPLRPYLVRQLTASVYTYARQQWRARKREVSLDVDLAESATGHSGGTAGLAESGVSHQSGLARTGSAGWTSFGAAVDPTPAWD